MASSGDSFLNKNWKITQWAPNPEEDLSEWLVEEGAKLKITADGEGFKVQWPDQKKNECSIIPPLMLKGEDLEPPPNKTIEIEIGSGPTRKTIGLTSVKVKLQVVVSMTRFGEGNVGTIIAEAQPVGEEH